MSLETRLLQGVDGMMKPAEIKVIPEHYLSIYTSTFCALHSRGLSVPNFRHDITGYVKGRYHDTGYRVDPDGNRLEYGTTAVLIETGDFPAFNFVLEAVIEADKKLRENGNIPADVRERIVPYLVDLASDSFVKLQPVNPQDQLKSK